MDNLGLEVTLATLRALTKSRKVDLMIVMQLQDFTRNVLDVLRGADDRARIDDFFGGVEWEVLARDLVSANASAATIASALVTFYGQRLQTIGYDYVAESVTVMKNSMNAAQYRIVLAGKDKAAVEFFRKIEKINPNGQRQLGY